MYCTLGYLYFVHVIREPSNPCQTIVGEPPDKPIDLTKADKHDQPYLLIPWLAVLLPVWEALAEPTSLNGYFTSSSLRMKCFLRFLVVTCSTNVSLPRSAMNLLMNLGSHSSDAIPRSLQHRIRAFDLQPSVAVGMPSGSKYCCSPLAIDTSLWRYQNIVLSYDFVSLTVHLQPAHTPWSQS